MPCYVSKVSSTFMMNLVKNRKFLIFATKMQVSDEVTKKPLQSYFAHTESLITSYKSYVNYR